MTSCIPLLLFVVKCHSRWSIISSFLSRVSPFSLFSLIVRFLCLLRLWSFWSTQQVQPRCSTVFSLSWACGNLCPFFPGFSFPTQGWATAMGYSSSLCPCPLGPSLPPCSLLVVQAGGLQEWASLPSLPVCFWQWEGVSSTFVLYCPFPHSWYLQLWFLSRSRVLVSPTLPSVGLGFPRWTVSLHLSPLLNFVDGRGGPGVLGFRRSCSSQLPSGSVSHVSPFVPEGKFVACFCLFFLFILFYIMVSVFFPHFCTGLLLCGCYMWGHLQDGIRQYPLYDLILYRHSSYDLSSYAVVWYWLQDDRHNVAWPCLPRSFKSLSPYS